MVTPSSNWITVSANLLFTTLLPMLVSVPLPGAGAVPPPKPSSSKPGPTVLALAIPSWEPRSPILGTKEVVPVRVIHDAPKRASFNMLGLKVWVHDPTALCSGAVLVLLASMASELVLGLTWDCWV